MNKKILVFLLFILCCSLPVIQAAGDNTVGFEFGVGVMVPLSNYDMKADNAFALALNLTDDTSVTIIREDGLIRGDNSYAEAGVKYTIVNEGNVSITGLRIMHALPFSLPLIEGIELGIDIGTARLITTNRFLQDNVDVGPGGFVDWGLGAAEPLTGSHPLLGLAVKLIILSKSSESLSTDLFICTSARFVDLPDTYALGATEAWTGNPAAIDPVNNFHNFNVLVGAKIGF